MTTHPSDLWPPAGLVVTAGDLTLTPIVDDDLPGLVDLVRAGVHAPDRMPFFVPWTTVPADELPRRFAQFHWQQRAQLSPEQLHIDLAVRRDGLLVGVQGFGGHDYPIVRTVETGSWLGLAHQGTGIGTRMRRAVCALLFDHLGAQQITSSAFVDNPASLAVSRKVGYVANGRDRMARVGVVAEREHQVLTPDRFVRGDPIEVSGVEPLRRFLGVEPTSS